MMMFNRQQRTVSSGDFSVTKAVTKLFRAILDKKIIATFKKEAPYVPRKQAPQFLEHDIVFSNADLFELEQDAFLATPPAYSGEVGFLFAEEYDEFTCETQLELQHLASRMPVRLSEETDYLVKLVENVLTLIRLLYKADSADDFIFAIGIFAQCRSNTSITNSLIEQWNRIMGISLQADDSATMFTKLRGLLDKYDTVKKLPIFTKLYKFLLYCVGTSLFEKMGIEVDTKKFLNLEKAAIKKEFHLGPDFVHCMLDTILFLCETGQQCMITGTIDPIFHHESSYEKWIQEGELLRTQSKYISNPEPHGFTVFDFLSRLDDNVEKGKSIVKFIGKNDVSNLIIRRLLSELENIRADCKTKRLAQQERKAPFSVLVHGGSSVAKSQFTKLLFYHYGKIFNLPIDDEYKYTRNAFDQYWTNFNTSQWCIQLDDIAYLHPNSSQGCDPSLLEMLQVINNVPYVPTQADLADKGKTPVRARFVIATTNTENLNAETYFACPLAVQRRLPYVITIEPKAEYCRDDGPMIDPAKIPMSNEGEYPDLWNILVKKVVPQGPSPLKKKTHMGQLAEYQLVEAFCDINDFLVWFSATARAAEGTQEKAMKCDTDMRSVTLCEHDIPLNRCSLCATQMQAFESSVYEQDSSFNTPWVNATLAQLASPSEDPGYAHTMGGIFQTLCTYDWISKLLVMFYYSVVWVANYFKHGQAFLMFFFGRWYVLYLLSRLLYIPAFRQLAVYIIGYRNYRRSRTPKALVFCSAIITGITILQAGRCLISVKNFISPPSKPKLPDVPVCIGCSKCNHLTFEERIVAARKIYGQGTVVLSQVCLQGAAAERGSAPEPKGDKQENVWYKDHFECTSFDVTPSMLSKCNWTVDETIKFISGNCVNFCARARTDSTIQERSGRGFCIGGHVYVFNNHCISFESFELELIFQSSKDGVTTNFTTLVTPAQILRFPERDIMFIRMPSIPPKKDLRELFAKLSYQGRFDSFYLSRDKSGDINTLNVTAPKLLKDFVFDDEDRNVQIRTNTWTGTVPENTEVGFCGSMLISKTAMGPVICGIHGLGSQTKQVFAFSLDYEFIQSLNFQIFSDSVPNLQVGDYKQELVELNHKATVRYISEGTMVVYGSLSGFRGRLKSRVTPTYMSDVAVRDGYARVTGKPVMNSYVPWRRAMLDMARPVTHIDLTLLRHCVTSFSKDILLKLTLSDLSELVVYDLNTALNGRPGLAYVDKMPRDTSAGFPFRKSKKFFLESVEPFGDYQHPVKVTPEIEAEMDHIIDQYENSRVYCPVFTASLKDEPTSLQKILDGKTRVFCGAPLPWSLVVRMYCLPIIRLIQKNRILFESGPGTIAQSEEWDQIYHYVTQFGKDRIVAGDYGKFDKRMPASVVLAAFDIIKNILSAAGWSERDLRVVSGIAEDTAFPTIDFHGELIRCYGTNPSGHPLTVIINGLANSLYVRYCYAINSPSGTCQGFKENVSLMTYGDDMITGISENCHWLNHTIMQKTLADIDIEFTMAEKSAKSVPFIHIDQATFLRRSWRFEPALGFHVCPIEHASIEKMLTMCVESKTVSKQLQAVSVLDTATREYFWYGQDIFDVKRKLFNQWIEELDLRQYMERDLPTWGQLIGEFNLNSALRRTQDA